MARPDRKTWEKGVRWATPFLEVKAGSVERVTIVSEKIEWYEMHWYCRRHRPCLAPTGNCDLCGKGIPTIPMGYCYSVRPGKSQLIIVKWTKGMFDSCPSLRNCQSIRGCEIRIWRKGEYAKGPILCALEGQLMSTDRLRIGPDVHETMRRIFASSAYISEPATPTVLQ